MEIERQFLVDIIPSLPSGYDSILQGYVSLLPEIRIRAVRPMQEEEKFYLTVKRGAGLVREEWETAISSREFSHLVECLEKNTFFIEKRRYYLPLADGTLQSTTGTAAISGALITSKWSSTTKKKREPLRSRTGSAARSRMIRASHTGNSRASTASSWPR